MLFVLRGRNAFWWLGEQGGWILCGLLSLHPSWMSSLCDQVFPSVSSMAVHPWSATRGQHTVTPSWTAEADLSSFKGIRRPFDRNAKSCSSACSPVGVAEELLTCQEVFVLLQSVPSAQFSDPFIHVRLVLIKENVIKTNLTPFSCFKQNKQWLMFWF